MLNIIMTTELFLFRVRMAFISRFLILGPEED